MTTEVRVLIQGNKACEVKVEGNAGDAPMIVKPGEFVSKYISGEQHLVVREIGEFLT